MKEASNRIVALLIAILTIITLVQFSVYYTRTGAITLKATAVGFVGLCADNRPVLVPIPDQIAIVNRSFTYDVNSTIPGDANVTFYDNTPMFNISGSTGVILFTPKPEDEGVHFVNISVASNCGRIVDSTLMVLTVRYLNRDPVLDPIPDFRLYQNDLFTYYVTASDADNDSLSFGENTSMFQLIPINSTAALLYFIPMQEDVGNHSVLFWVTDGLGGIDWQVVNFEIIDVNDPPYLDTIGSRTALINYTFNLKINASDIDVRPEWNNLTFFDNATFFDIDNKTGLISFNATDDMNGTYWINISVTDDYLWDWEVISFSVIPENHPPNITSWYPYNESIEIDQGQTQYFNITKYDPDGTIPSVQWYVDTNPQKDEILDDYYFYSGSFSVGVHNVTVIISDGELTDSHRWIVTVKPVARPPTGGYTPPASRPPPCVENWRCSEWSVCPVYGIQTRTCNDLNSCGTATKKPLEQRGCVYVALPTCGDGVTNCHDGACEIWIDCGGPCPQCPTCSDKISNCHTLPNGKKSCEESVDCGGPCPPCAPPKLPVCGNAICEEGELFLCIQDCGLFFGQFILVVVVLAGASIFGYRAYSFAAMLYRKRRPLPYTNLELLGTQTLRKIHLIQLEIGKKPMKTIVAEFSFAMRDFFAKAFDIRKKYTYIELAEMARKKKIDKLVANRITEFCIKMTEIEYSTSEAKLQDLTVAIKSAIFIVEKLTGVKFHESLDKRAEDELKKTQPKEEQVKLSGEAPVPKVKRYERTREDDEIITRLEKLITDGEWAISNKRIDEAEKTYSQIRELYDRINPELKKELYSETIRIIKMYNTLTGEVK
jgi:hypothetical protein